MSARSVLLDLNETLKRSTRLYMVLVAVAIGLLAGYGAVGFRFLIHGLQDFAWQTSDFGIAWVETLPWWVVMGVPAVGGLIVGSITHFFAKEAQGHGVPEVMEAVALRQGFIRPRVVVAKALASSISIASGGSVGREGPIVQIGSALGSTVGQVMRVGPVRMRTLVGCGAAAGIAATFNAPVAGALFAVEILLGDFGVPQFSPIVISSVTATVVSRRYLGDLPAFELPVYSFQHPIEFVAYCVLGLLAGLLAFVFVRTLYWTEDRFDDVPVPLPIKAAVGGATVGALALVYPHVLGVGYETMNMALMESPGVMLLAGVLVAKLLAVCITLGSGGSGGVFAPSLFLGATLGALVGAGASAVFPEHTAPMGAYALVGMGAVVAAGTHAPITAILIIFELTNEYKVILPLMTSCILATLLATRLNKESIYTLKLVRRGINIRGGQDVNLLKHIPVGDVLRTEVATMHPSEGLVSILTRTSLSDASTFYLVDAQKVLLGVIGMSEIRPLLSDADVLGNLVVAQDIANTHVPSVSVDDSLDTVLQQLQGRYRDELPVLDDGRLVGVVQIEDVLTRYRVELRNRMVHEGMLGDDADEAGASARG